MPQGSTALGRWEPRDDVPVGAPRGIVLLGAEVRRLDDEQVSFATVEE